MIQVSMTEQQAEALLKKLSHEYMKPGRILDQFYTSLAELVAAEHAKRQAYRQQLHGKPLRLTIDS